MKNQTKHRNHNGAGRGARMRERAREEIRRFLFLFVYLWVMLGLFVLNESIVARERGIDFTYSGFAVINALVLAKVMLIIEDLGFDRLFKSQPKIWSIVFESVLCTVLLMGFHVVEHVVIGAFRGESIAASVPSFGGGGTVGILLVAIIMFVSLVPFFGFKNITRAIGWGRMKEILFHRPQA